MTMHADALQFSRSSTPPAAAAFARVEVYDDPGAALDVWRALPPASFYQTEKFLLAWIAVFAAKDGMEPFFIVARDDAGAPLALLPLGLFRYGLLRVAQFPGRKHSNYNLGLFLPGCDFSVRDFEALLRVAAIARRGPHLYRLCNVPLTWRGARNPLTLLPHRPAASHSYATSLPSDGEAFLRGRLSSGGRKAMRKKEMRLAAMGALRYFRAGSAEEARKIVETFFAHKKGLASFRDGDELERTRDFYLALTEPGDPSAVELHALALDEKIIATFGAGRAGARLQGLFISYDPEPEIAKSSPGEILLSYVLRDACARNFSSFDLGVGDARYKSTFCNQVEHLADALFAPTWAGMLARPYFVAALAAKAAIKQNPRLFALTMKLQALASRFASGGQ
jgi:CelD/BcsL family acetyltransferase involved in cellulose biosynthesis